MKYTRLPLQDLKDLEKEFVEFLVLNGIPADEWERLKKEENDKAEAIIDQFSDVVWEGVLRKVEMVEFRRKDSLTICRVKDDTLETLLVKANKEEVDFTKEEDLEKCLGDLGSYSLHLKTEALTKPAPEVLFQFISIGFLITKDERFKALFLEANQ